MQTIQIVSIIGSLTFFIIIIELIRKKRLKEAYAIIWLFFAILFLFFSIWRKALDYIATLFGIYYPPALLFLMLIVTLLLVILQISVVISKQSEQIKTLAQEIALLKAKDMGKSEKIA